MFHGLKVDIHIPVGAENSVHIEFTCFIVIVLRHFLA